MRPNAAALALAGFALVAACETARAPEPAERARARLLGANAERVGEVVLRETPHGTLLRARLENLPAGVHAFHVHAVGECEPPFASAGGHFAPALRRHGILSAEGMHAGDMPNIHVPASGALDIEILNAGLALDGALFDGDGAALVIHAGPDDYRTNPAGAAGPRIACGVIGREAR